MLENATKHVDDELVGEAALTLVKEMIEWAFKFLEHSRILNQVSLHLGCDLLIEVEFLNNKIEIVKESLLNIFPNIVVECWLDMERLVWLLNFLDPHVQWVELLLNQVIEVVRCAENARDWTHQEREEGQSQKLEQDREDVLLLRLPRVISIAYSSDYLEDPVEGENVYWCIVFLSKVRALLIDPRFSARFVFYVVSARVFFTKENEDASAAMTDVDDVQDESAKARQIVLPLFGVLLQQNWEKKLKWLRDPEEVNDSEALQEVEWEILAALYVEEAWNCGNNIEHKIRLDVVVADWW